MTTTSVATEPPHALGPRELELLLALARLPIEPSRANRARELARGTVEWPRVIAAAHLHGVVPLVYRQLSAVCRDVVPCDALNELARRAHHHARRNLCLTRELLRILARLDAAGIDAMPFKGPVLAASVYGDVSLRQFGDLDLLVRRRDVRSATRILEASGCRARSCIALSRQPAFLDSQCALTFGHEHDPFVVDLHWRFAPRYFAFPLDAEALWERLEIVGLGSGRVRAPAPEDLLLILCVHGAKHGWERLEWLCDIAELIRARSGLGWRRLDDQARACGWHRAVSLGLTLAAEVLDAPVPEWRLQNARDDRGVARLAAIVGHRLRAPGPRQLREAIVFQLMARERLGGRLRHALGLVATPTASDWDFLPLPERLSFLYRAVRAVRITRKYIFGATTGSAR